MSGVSDADIRYVMGDLIGQEFRVRLDTNTYMDGGHIAFFQVPDYNPMSISETGELWLDEEEPGSPQRSMDEMIDNTIVAYRTNPRRFNYTIRWTFPVGRNGNTNFIINTKVVGEYMRDLGAHTIVIITREDGPIDFSLTPGPFDQAVDEYPNENLRPETIDGIFNFFDKVFGG